MEENPSPVRPKDGTHEASRTVSIGKNHRHPVEDDNGDLMECSFKNCRSCTAGVIADCVAVCCCPCAVVSVLAFAFVKIPWTMGKRCLRLGKKKGRKLEKKRTFERNESDSVVESDGISRIARVGEGTLEILSPGFGENEEDDNFSARFEAERVWLELYQVGHLDFGRVSFTGIQSLGKGN